MNIGTNIMSNDKELAYRYDLFVTPDWKDRFDLLVNENVEMPLEGRILDVNCGTGAHAIELAERMRDKGEVIALDPSAERIELARAKAQAKKTTNVTFEQGSASNMSFESHEFDAVIGDASLLRASEIEDVVGEMVRVAAPDSRVVLKLTTHGSFDEFFSIYWEAMHDAGLDGEVWTALEGLISERLTVSGAEQMAGRAGLRNVESFVSKEEFSYETAEDFFESPLIKDYFLFDWLEIVPEASREDLQRRIASIIERERHNASFEVSIKATAITGTK